MAPVPQTNTGGQVENTKANGITVVKELGKMPPYLREKEDPIRVTALAARARRGGTELWEATVY